MYGQALSKVTKDQDPIPMSDEDKVALQDVEDDVYADSQQQVNGTALETNDSDPTVMDVYFCTNCLKKGLSEKEKREHEEETGHKLDRVKLPNFLQIWIQAKNPNIMELSCVCIFEMSFDDDFDHASLNLHFSGKKIIWQIS